MTIKIRNTIFISSLTAAGLLFLAYLGGTFYMVYSYSLPYTSLIDPTSALFSLTRSAAYLLYALIAGIILLHSFRKTSSPEVFFILIFLLTFSLEALDIGLLYIREAGFPLATGRALSRGIYFGRYLGTISLFISGLFACGIRYQRLELLLGIATLAAFGLAVSIPLDNRTIDSRLLYTNNLASEFFVGFIIIKGFAFCNYIYAGIINNSKNYFAIGLGVLMILAGRELSIRCTMPLFAGLSLLLLATGTILLGIRIHKIYLWF